MLYHITQIPVLCDNELCLWEGTVGDCEPDQEGDLHCPKCDKLLTIIVDPESISGRTFPPLPSNN